MGYKIFIIEDDLSISNLLKENLEKYSYSTMAVKDFENIIEEFKNFSPELVLLDVNLPRFDGFYWCRKIRELSTVPIIFISARESKMDQVMALENGGDDYITKPFYTEVLIAKINSHLRRSYGSYSPKTSERVVEKGSLKYYPERLELRYKEQALVLTKTEGILLEALMKAYPRVVGRDYLLERIWDDTTFVEENTLNVNVARLRKRLQSFIEKNPIETIRGVGYKLNEAIFER